MKRIFMLMIILMVSGSLCLAEEFSNLTTNTTICGDIPEVQAKDVKAKKENKDKKDKKQKEAKKEKLQPGTMLGKVILIYSDTQGENSRIAVVDENGTEWSFAVKEKPGKKNKPMLSNIKEGDKVKIKYSEVGVRVYEAKSISKE